MISSLCWVNATESMGRACNIELVCDTEQTAVFEATNDVFLSWGWPGLRLDLNLMKSRSWFLVILSVSPARGVRRSASVDAVDAYTRFTLGSVLEFL